MKTTSKHIILALALLCVGVFAACKSSDPLAKQRAIEELDQKVADARYTFEATRANPMSGRSISLTSSYNLKVTPDTIVAHLPYFGRAYSAPSPTTEGGIKFTSTKFEYHVSEKRKGVYTVSIEIKDNSNTYKLSLLIGETGSGTLHVSQRDKQNITFYGNID